MSGRCPKKSPTEIKGRSGPPGGPVNESETCGDPLLFGMVASVLSGWHDPNDPAGLADAVGRAAASDWRAAAWMLEHHPATREDFGDVARDERVRRELLAKVCNAIAAAHLAPEDERRVLLQLQAHGATVRAEDCERDWEAMPQRQATSSEVKD